MVANNVGTGVKITFSVGWSQVIRGLIENFEEVDRLAGANGSPLRKVNFQRNASEIKSD